MAKPEIRIDDKQVLKHLGDLARKQIPFATALGLTGTAKAAQTVLTMELPSIFHHPTPFTQRAIGVQAARKDTLTAAVFVKPIQARYLTLEQTGGFRSALSSGKLPEPVDMKTNAYGNIPRGQIARLAAGQNYFVGNVRGVTGLWRRPTARKGGHLQLLARFVRGWKIEPKFDFYTRISATVRHVLPAEMKKALARAIGTAR